VLLRKYAELIHKDQERLVVMAALGAYSKLLKEIKAPLVHKGYHTIIRCIKDVMAYKVLILDLLFFCNKFVIHHIEIGKIISEYHKK
jgi:ABC-type arginine transport system permease subunit